MLCNLKTMLTISDIKEINLEKNDNLYLGHIDQARSDQRTFFIERHSFMVLDN